MKVAEFIKILRQCSPDAEIMLSKDSEGNGFYPIDEIASVLYSPNAQGDIYNLNERNAAGENAINALVLYPLNSYSLKGWKRAQLEQKSS